MSQEALSGLILGWFLGLVSGLVSPLIVDAIRNQRKRQEVRTGILTELTDLKQRLAGVAYYISDRHGTHDRDFLTWVLEKLQGDNEPSYQRIAATVRQILTLTDEQIAALARQRKTNADQTIPFRKYDLPFLDSQIHYVSAYPAQTQRELFEIRAQLKMFHEQIDDAREYQRMTFDLTIGSENHDRVSSNLREVEDQIANRTRTIANRIEALRIPEK